MFMMLAFVHVEQARWPRDVFYDENDCLRR